MKKRISPYSIFRGSALVAATVGLAAVFSGLTSPSSVAGTNNCTVCHKRNTTLVLACNSLEYQRHLDHGDPMNACNATPPAADPVSKESGGVVINPDAN